MESKKKDEYLYVMLSKNFDDNIILDNSKDAIVLSCEYPHLRVLIFKKNENNAFKPINRYYLGGKLI